MKPLKNSSSDEKIKASEYYKNVAAVIITGVIICVLLILFLVLAFFISEKKSTKYVKNDNLNMENKTDYSADNTAAAEDTISAAARPEKSDTLPETEFQTSESYTESETIAYTGIEAIIDSMTLEEKIYQLFIVSPEKLTGVSCATAAGDATREALNNYPVGGVILFSQNLETRQQTTEMISNMQEYAKSSCGIGLFVAVDEEGGQISRVANKLGTTSYESMQSYGGRYDLNEIYNVGSGIGADIAQFGFNVDFAPVADVNINPANELNDYNRIFSSDASVVSDMTASFVKGLKSQGVCSTLKHFPGLGAEDSNTHQNSEVVIYRTYEELASEEFAAFKGGIDAGSDFVMVGHQKVSGLSDGLPSDLSYTVCTEWLREDLGFNGIAVTDSHSGMSTITNNYSSGTAAVMAIQAGIDIVLDPVSLYDACSGVYNAVLDGTITEERIDKSLTRILTVKKQLGLIE